MASSSRMVRVTLTRVSDVPTLLKLIESLHKLGQVVRVAHFDLDEVGHGIAIIKTSHSNKTLDKALHQKYPDVYLALEDVKEENGHDPQMA